MIRFDTRNTKPKIRILAYLTFAFSVLLGGLWIGGYYSFTLFCAIIAVYLGLAVFILLNTLRKQMEYNPYSYNTIYYSAFALLGLFYLLALTRLIFGVHQSGMLLTYGYDSLVGELLGFAKKFMIMSFPFILLFSAWLCASNISLIRHEGKRITNLLGIALSFALIGGDLILFFTDYAVSGSRKEIMFHDLAVNLYAAVYLYFEVMMIGTILANLIVYRHEPEKDKDFIIILGCGLQKDGTVTPLLAGRIERALHFYNDQIKGGGKPPLFITSGGQGSDEATAESTAMKNYLLSRGVKAADIIEENRSTSTYENMLYSKEIINSMKENAKVIFSTTQYHVFRAGLKARRVKMRATGIGSKTKWYFWPNAMVREFAGLLSEHRFKQILILCAMVILYAAGTWYYYTNF